MTKSRPPTWTGYSAADEAEVAAQLEQEPLELLDQGPLQVGLGMRRRKVKELNEIRILEDRGGIGVQFSQRC